MRSKTRDKGHIKLSTVKNALDSRKEKIASGKDRKAKRSTSAERSDDAWNNRMQVKPLDVADIIDLESMFAQGHARYQASLEGAFNFDTETEEGEKQVQRMELGLVATLDEIFKSGITLPPDLKIDDRDLKAMPNIYDWCFSKQGAAMKPFARQYEVMIKTTSDWCPRCTKKRWPRNKPGFAKTFLHTPALPVDFDVTNVTDYVQHLEFGRCPCCEARKSELVRSGELPLVTEADLCLGQRSGKSSTLYSEVPYLIHKWLKVPSPVQALGLLNNTILSGTVVALTYAKAIELLWQPIHNALTNVEWFKEYHALLNHYAEYYGEEIFKFKDTFVQYSHRNMFFSASGPNKRTLRGATRIISLTDELGFFYHGDDGDEKERASANEVYVSLGNSLMTVKKSAMLALERGMDTLPMTLMANISSPSSYKDKIMSLVREFENEPTVVTMHLPTWEFNPLYTKADFKKEYAADPVKAERDFGANPPMSENPFIPDLEPMKRQVVKSQRNVVDYEYRSKKSTSGAAQRFARIKRFRPIMGDIKKHILTIDAGYSNNSFALVAGYPEMYRDKLRLQVTAAVEIAPKKGQNTLNYTKITKEVIYPMIEELNVGLVVTDRWNSLKLLHDIEDDYGIFTEQYSLKAPDFQLIYDYLTDEDFAYARLPVPEVPIDTIMEIDIDEYPQCFGPGNKTTGKPMPITHLIHQSQTVQVNSRGIVDKGLGMTDDLFRAYMLLVHYGVDEEMVEQFDLLKGAVAGAKRAIGAMANAGFNPGAKLSGTKAMRNLMGSVAGANSAGSGSTSRVMARRRT